MEDSREICIRVVSMVIQSTSVKSRDPLSDPHGLLSNVSDRTLRVEAMEGKLTIWKTSAVDVISPILQQC